MFKDKPHLYDEDCAHSILSICEQFFRRTRVNHNYKRVIKGKFFTHESDMRDVLRAERLNYAHSSHLVDGEVLLDFSPCKDWIRINPKNEERIVNLATYKPNQEQEETD
jgi:hypothetical protein